MTTLELKEWMEEAIVKRLDSMDKKVTSHDRWLWFIKGVGVLGVLIIGWVVIALKKFNLL